MNNETAVELARIVGKAEAGKKLTAIETLMLLPYSLAMDIEERLRRREVESLK